MSNQNEGAKPCEWCILWNAAFAASRIDHQAFHHEWHEDLWRLESSGDWMLARLSNRHTDCPGCQRSAEMYRGEVLGAKQAAWRAEMWASNPSMRQFMRAGPGDTFGEGRAP